MVKPGYINNFMGEAYEYVFKGEPFNFINKYYKIATGRKLYEENHVIWLDRNFEHYRKYQSAKYEDTDAEALSMMDTLEEIIESCSNTRLYLSDD